jgi:PAS domain S-box-containing protein
MEPAAVSASRPTVMVVEDEGLVALTIKNKLQSLGYEVPLVVGSGEEAVQKAGEVSPNLILMDIRLDGEMDGITAGSIIRSQMCVPIVYLTAYSDDDTLRRARVAEPFGYLIKPFDGVELKTTIEMALYKHSIELKLRESERWLATTLRSIGDGVIATDSDGHVKFINPVAESLTGWEREEAAGLKASAIFRVKSETAPQTAVDYIAKSIDKRIAIELPQDSLLTSRDGRDIDISDSISPIVDDDGRVLGAVVVFRDVSERRRILKELQHHRDHLQELVNERTQELVDAVHALERANRVKSEFLANISHEVRTPLNHVLGFTQLVVDQRAGDLNPKQKEYLSFVLESGRHLLELINDILDLAKVESGKLALEPAELRLKDLLEGCLQMLGLKAGEKNIRMVSRIENAGRTLKADDLRLRQVLNNLLANAVKFTPRGGTITLASRDLSGKEVNALLTANPVGAGSAAQPWIVPPQGSFVEISVRDTGIGLLPQDLHRIFERFEQVDSSSARRFQGTGLGLALCRQLIELHGGVIWAESPGPHQGSTFRFILPAA